MYWLSHSSGVSMWLWTQVVQSALPVSQIEAKLLYCCFPSGANGKELSANSGDIRDVCSIPGLGRSPGGGHGNPLTVFLPGESHGQRSLAGYSPQGHKELATTEAIQEAQFLKATFYPQSADTMQSCIQLLIQWLSEHSSPSLSEVSVTCGQMQSENIK